uniref:RCC1 domain containing 1 n=1 Tax=Neogobius melanostomus TaxID=47308 RepID=A0A8C6SNC0_9GOBI
MVKALSMRWFGFGFNEFGQIVGREQDRRSDDANEVKVVRPTEVARVNKCSCKVPREILQVRTSWSARLSDCKILHSLHHQLPLPIQFLTHSSKLKVKRAKQHSIKRQPIVAYLYLKLYINFFLDPPLKLPLVSKGYIALKPPFYRPLSPHLKAKSLALGPVHAILLCTTGAVYTWGLGSHGQLGHGSLTSEEEPRTVEALWGVPMKAVAAGGWHCCCISETADLYVWGWNESGQLGLPSRGVRKAQGQNICGKEEDKEIFISIQAFPALLDLNPPCEIKAVSCGSRHTAAITTEGNLYTWGWGQYGQLGHQNVLSSDEPQCVEFFKEHQLCVSDVVCGVWNTFAAVVKQEESENYP